MTQDGADPIRDFVRSHLRRKVERAGEGASIEAMRDTVAVETATEHPVPADVGFDLPESHSIRRYEVKLRVSEITVELNAHDGTVLGWIMPALAEDSSKDLDETALLEVATRAARPPPTAVLAEAGYEEVAGQPVYSARWVHVEQGLRVERDYLRVLVNGATGRVFAGYRRWHAVDFLPTER